MYSKINYFFLINKDARLLTYRRAQIFFIRFEKRVKNSSLVKCYKTMNLL